MRFAVAVFALLVAPTAMAGADRCSAPFGPVVPDGATASQGEMRNARAEVLAFVKDSDTYQDCLVRVMDDPKEEMKEPQKKAVLKQISANQREKEEVATAFNTALKAFKARGLTLD
ncbi:MAG: hypothetical protein QM698_07510 [Micropepsaceae bacterium]